MKYLIIFAIACMPILCLAQSCNYYYLQNNKTIEMTMYGKKGEPAGKVIYKISDVKKAGGTTTAKVNSQVQDKNGKLIGSGASVMQCTNGQLKVDMKMMLPAGQQGQFTADVNANSSYIEYPVTMAVGDKLADANFNMDMDMSTGLRANVEMEVKDRQVVAKESVTTPAGTWECYKINYKSKMMIRMGIGIPVKQDITEWFAPGFGVVKTQAKNSSTEITSIK